jgi:uncharacterized protein (DUF1778 family)
MERSSLLISCSSNEAASIREKAAGERRTISAYVLRIALSKAHEDIDLPRRPQYGGVVEVVNRDERVRTVGRRVMLHIRCSDAESASIRQAAEQTGKTISAYVLDALQRWWHRPEFATLRNMRSQTAPSRLSGRDE